MVRILTEWGAILAGSYLVLSLIWQILFTLGLSWALRKRIPNYPAWFILFVLGFKEVRFEYYGDSYFSITNGNKISRDDEFFFRFFVGLGTALLLFFLPFIGYAVYLLPWVFVSIALYVGLLLTLRMVTKPKD